MAHNTRAPEHQPGENTSGNGSPGRETENQTAGNHLFGLCVARHPQGVCGQKGEERVSRIGLLFFGKGEQALVEVGVLVFRILGRAAAVHLHQWHHERDCHGRTNAHKERESADKQRIGRKVGPQQDTDDGQRQQEGGTRDGGGTTRPGGPAETFLQAVQIL